MGDITIEPKAIIALRGEGPLFTAKYMLKSQYDIVSIQVTGPTHDKPNIPVMSVDEVVAKMFDEQGFSEGIVAARYIVEVNGAPNSPDTALADRVYPLLKQYDIDPTIDVSVIFLSGNQDMVDLAISKGYPCINKSHFDSNFLNQF